MKRFVMALPVVAAVVLFCLPAIAGDTSTASILPEPVKAHWFVALMVVLIPVVRTSLSNDTWKLPTKAAPYRMLIIAGLSAAGIVVDGLSNGFDFKTVLASFLATGLPSLLQEIVKLVFGGPPSSTSGKGGAMFPAAMLSALALCAASIASCGYGKAVCGIIDTAADLCPLIAVRLPDGTVEMVPRESIMGAAMQARAMRTAGAKASDAGADQ